MKRFKFLRDNDEVAPSYTEDNLYMEVEDVNNGETFGIPFRMSEEISRLGLRLYHEGRTVSGRCEYSPYEYWIDNVYRTVNHTMIIEAIISIPMGNGRSKIRRIRQIIPYNENI